MKVFFCLQNMLYKYLKKTESVNHCLALWNEISKSLSKCDIFTPLLDKKSIMVLKILRGI